MVGDEMHEKNDNGKWGSQLVPRPECWVIQVYDEATRSDNRNMDGDEYSEPNAKIFNEQKLSNWCM